MARVAHGGPPEGVAADGSCAATEQKTAMARAKVASRLIGRNNMRSVGFGVVTATPRV
jgi:hypothetical protein